MFFWIIVINRCGIHAWNNPSALRQSNIAVRRPTIFFAVSVLDHQIGRSTSSTSSRPIFLLEFLLRTALRNLELCSAIDCVIWDCATFLLEQFHRLPDARSLWRVVLHPRREALQWTPSFLWKRLTDSCRERDLSWVGRQSRGPFVAWWNSHFQAQE